ncbi:kelch repeat-containing protein [Streptomyces sp. NPDC046821]|uniref:kelch repeat-containing protein n=1 Tax=Streptomyces sp. NPDC046821 TaxID=3154702 RepID=UPI0033FA933A
MRRRPLFGISAAAVVLAAGLVGGGSVQADEAPEVTVSATELTATAELGKSAETALTFANHGTQAHKVIIGESTGDFTIQRAGAARKDVKGTADPHRLTADSTKSIEAEAQLAEAPWESITAHPVPVMDNLVSVGPGGKVYSVAGVSNAVMVSTVRAYDPVTGAWSSVAPLSAVREKPTGGFVDGKLYVTGGWNSSGRPIETTEVYDPQQDTWTEGAPNPEPLAAASSAVLDGKLYTVGGCDKDVCGQTTVQSYDPAADTWSAHAPYPEPVSWTSCGAIAGRLYCAGGYTDGGGATPSTYTYDPATDSWAKLRNMPESLWASGFTAADGRLLVSGGSTGEEYTNAGYQYEPAADTWSALPNSGQISYRGGSACGLYRVGGTTGGFVGTTDAERLPGYDSCGSGVDWLTPDPSEFVLDPGQERTVTVTLDSANLAQPGTYTAALTVNTGGADRIAPIKVTFKVTAPPQWGKLKGTITSATCAAASPGPLSAATITLSADGFHRVLRTGRDGTYALWTGKHEGPLTVIIAKDDWRARTTEVTLTDGETRDVSFALTPYPFCPKG